MGRKSALTEQQWQAIEKRILGGEPVRALAREFDISEAAIRKRLGARTKTIKDVANQLVTAETALAALPISAQISARTYADELKAMRASMMSAGASNAGIVQRVTAIANAQIQKVDDSDPFSNESVAAIKGVSALMNVANIAAEIPMAILKISKEIAPGKGEGDGAGDKGAGIQAAPEYKLVTDEPIPGAPIL